MVSRTRNPVGIVPLIMHSRYGNCLVVSMRYVN
jgi:hypothetical protein